MEPQEDAHRNMHASLRNLLLSVTEQAMEEPAQAQAQHAEVPEFGKEDVTTFMYIFIVSHPRVLHVLRHSELEHGLVMFLFDNKRYS